MKIGENINLRLLFLISICVLSTIFILYLILKFASYGIDFTDEGYYLNSISNPYLYERSLSQFGFIYHPIYNLVDENIASLRRINFVITFGLATILNYLLINQFHNAIKINKIIRIIISSGVAITSFTYIYIQTPSYNHLILQALLVTCIGILLINNKYLSKNIYAYIILGIGGWLAFMAKPSSAIGLSLVILIYLLISLKFKFKYILISILTSLLLLFITALIIDTSVVKFFYRYVFSLEISKLLQGYNINSIFRIDELNLSFKIISSILVIFILTLLCVWLECYKSPFTKIISIIFSFSFFIFILSISIFDINWNPNYGYYQTYQVFGIVLACILIFLIFLLKKKIFLNEINWSLAFVFLLLPYISALGTNNNYWMQSGIASVFWLIIGFIFIIPLCLKIKKIQLILILVIISQVVATIHIKEKIEEPYRNNQPLRLNNVNIKTNYKNNSLFVSSEFAKYIKDARRIAKKSGFQRGKPIIDLTGQSPGIVYLINAKSIGTAWNIGGYKGSFDIAKAKYDLINCSEIANSWILTEINGPRSISADLLSSLGMDFPLQYELVGTWKTAIGAGGYKKIRLQQLFKPINIESAIKSCNSLRM